MKLKRKGEGLHIIILSKFAPAIVAGRLVTGVVAAIVAGRLVTGVVDAIVADRLVTGVVAGRLVTGVVAGRLVTGVAAGRLVTGVAPTVLQCCSPVTKSEVNATLYDSNCTCGLWNMVLCSQSSTQCVVTYFLQSCY